MKNSFYNEIYTKKSRSDIKIDEVKKVREKLKDFDSDKYIATISTLKRDIEDLSLWINLMIPYIGIIFSLTNVDDLQNNTAFNLILMVVTAIVATKAVYSWSVRSKYVELLSVLENCKDYVEGDNLSVFSFDIEIDEKVVGKLILKEEK